MIIKCLDKLLLHTILSIVNQQLDPLQFAYRDKRGTENCGLRTAPKIIGLPRRSASTIAQDMC